MKKRVLNYIERAIIKSMKRGKKNITSLHFDTSLPPHIVHNTLKELISQGIVKKKMAEFHLCISSEHSSLWEMDEIEILSLISQAYTKQDTGQFNFQTVALSTSDLTEFEKLSCQMNSLVKDCQRFNSLPIKDSRFLFWGQIGHNQLLI